MSNDETAEKIRDLVAREEGGITEGAENYAVITVVVEEHVDTVDTTGIYTTNFKANATDATASALAKAVGVTMPKLLLELALAEQERGIEGEYHE